MFSGLYDAFLQVSRMDTEDVCFKLVAGCEFVVSDAGMPDEQRSGLQEELIDIILRVLVKNPQLHYYQGYHDIVVTFLLVLGERLATALVEKLSTHHLR